MKCDICKEEIITSKDSMRTGYVITDCGRKKCYTCLANSDRITMITDGHSKRLPLYYDENTNEITNWPGTLKFKAGKPLKSRHNWGLTRIDVWFNGPDKHVWHGYTIGHNTQIIHCKRTKERIESWLITETNKELSHKTGWDYIRITNKHYNYLSQEEFNKANELARQGWEIIEMAQLSISLMRKHADK